MYVFLLAGSEVVLSAVVLATCNFLFIKTKSSEPGAELENGPVAKEMEQLNKPPLDGVEEKGEKEEREKTEVTEIKEKEDTENEKDKAEIRPDSVTVDSEEVEKFLKEPEHNGSVLSSPETCL